MPVLPLRRTAAASPTPSRTSPERAKLAEAITTLAETEATHAALVAADAWDGPAARAERAARDALEATQAALEQARQDAASYLVATSMGNAKAPATTMKDARAAVQQAEDDIAAVVAARATIRERVAPSANALDTAKRKVESAAWGVIRSEANIEALLTELDAHYRAIVDKGRALCVLTGANGIPRNGPDAHPQASYVWSLLTNAPMNWGMWHAADKSPSSAAWEAALDALKTDATATLPGTPGTP